MWQTERIRSEGKWGGLENPHWELKIQGWWLEN